MTASWKLAATSLTRLAIQVGGTCRAFCPARAYRTAVFRPEKLQISRSSCRNDRGKANAAGLPPRAARSISGPPGYPRPSRLATLSKASPAASSVVPPRSSLLERALATIKAGMPPRNDQSHARKDLAIGISELAGVKMTLEVIDGDQRDIECQRQGLGRRQPHDQGADQPGPRRHRHRPEIGQ